MHAFLLVGRENSNFKILISKLATKNNAKILPFVLQKMEDTRELKKLVKFSFSEKTAIVIENIDNATEETLNALLKNLEEPNENLIYILTASNLNNVLPTIVSRCEVIQTLNSKHDSDAGYLIPNKLQITNFLNSKLTQKFEIIGKIKERETAIKFVEDLIFTSNVRVRPSHAENYLKTLKNLKLNGNVGLQLTNLVVKMNNHG